MPDPHDFDREALYASVTISLVENTFGVVDTNVVFPGSANGCAHGHIPASRYTTCVAFGHIGRHE